MCDYSLHAIHSRRAKAGDLLITSEFPNTTTRGFSAAAEPGMAVCLLPGTELAFSEEAVCNHSFATLFPRMHFGSIGARLARFRKINQRTTDTHHDALEFANGKIVLLTRLRPGQRATVLQLPTSDNADGKRLESERRQPASVARNAERLAGH
ncbi:hypothetical protein J6497_31775 [Bradyrhizobium sp. CNPSo 4026]|nr:hypothetical protein [Bradyrhizobium cenepequi]